MFYPGLREQMFNRELPLHRHFSCLATQKCIAETLQDMDEPRIVHDVVDMLRHPGLLERLVTRPASTTASRTKLLGQCYTREFRLLERSCHLEKEPVVVLCGQADYGAPDDV